jgi:hypothetical protein
MGGIYALSCDFLEFEGKFGKYFTGQDVKRDCALPYSKLFKSSIYVFPIHDSFIDLAALGQAMNHDIFQAEEI